MSLLYPLFLTGLLAISIPVIVHLFNFQKPKSILFTNVRFLKNIQESTTAKSRLKHLLVLASRICFIVFLVLAFTQPVFQGKNAGLTKGKKNVSVYLDNSFSMENQLEQDNIFDIGLKSSQSLAEVFSPNTKFNLLTNDFEGKDLFFKNRDKFSERLTEISYSPVYRSADEITDRQRSIIEKGAIDNNVLFWFSDFQKNTIGGISDIRLDSTSKYFFVPVQNQVVSNIIIDSVWLDDPFIKKGELNSIKVRLINLGDSDSKNIPVKLIINDVQSGQLNADIPGNGSVIKAFSFSIQDTSHNLGVIAIEDNPIRFDNHYYFTLNPETKVNIYHIRQGQGSGIEKVYRNESVFNIETTSIGDIDYSKIEQSDLVVLEGITGGQTGLIDGLQQLMNKGGTVLIFPARGGDQEFLKKILPEAGISTIFPDTSLKSSFIVSPPDYRNPFFEGIFEKYESNINMPYGIPTLKLANPGSIVLRYKDDSPFLSRYAHLKGKAFVFTSPLEKDLNNFDRHSLFVPIMYNLGFQSLQATEPLAYSFQEPSITLKIDDGQKGTVYNLEEKASGLKVIPSQKINDKLLYLEVPSDKMKAGFYRLTGGKEEKLIAFNYGSKESMMDFYTPEELKSIFKNHKNVSVLSMTNSEDFKETFKNENIGTPLWKYCLFLALIFLLTEILLIRFL